MDQQSSYVRVILLLTAWAAAILLFPERLCAQADPTIGFTHAQQNNLRPMAIKAGFVRSNMSGYLYQFSTRDSTIGINAFLNGHEKFYRIKEELPDLGMDSRYHWIRFAIRNASNKTQSLISNLHFKEFNHISFYVVDEQNNILFRQENFARKTPISEKPILTRYFAFPIRIQPGQQLTIYWCGQREHSVVLMPLRLYSKEGFFKYMFTADFLLYFSLGVVAVAAILTGILYLVTRRRLLLYYAGYTLFYGLSLANLEGILTPNFNINIPYLDENTNVVFIAVVAFFMTLFSISFLQIESYAPKWLIMSVKVLCYLSLAFIFYAWFTPFSNFNATLSSLLSLVTLLAVAAMIIYGIIWRKYESFLYLVAIGPLFVMSVWFATAVLVGMPRTWLFFEASHYSSLFEIVVLGAGIGYKLVRDRDEYLLQLNRLQKEFTSSILQTQDMERQRIAADLHDDLGGTLATIRRSISDLMAESTNPETVKKFQNLEPLIQKSSEDLRRISHNLMPPEFDRIGLSNSLSQLVLALPAAPTRFQFLCSGTEQRLGRDIELNAYRIVSELIQNILKHARAKQAAIQLIYFENFLRIMVEDDGLGSITGKMAPQSPGIGLKNCILRADYIGATLKRETSKGGSIIVLDIPFKEIHPVN